MNPRPGRAPGQILILVNERRPFWVFARSFWRRLSMRNILIHADASPAMAARTETALRVGRHFRSHLSFLIASPYQQFIASDPFGGMYLAREQLRSEEHTSELQSLMRISYAVFCLKKKKNTTQ